MIGVMKWLAVAGATALMVLIGVLVVRADDADLAPAPARWTAEPVAPGMAARAYAPEKPAKNCEQFTTAVAAHADQVWSSEACATGAGDEDAPQPDPAYALDRLLFDGRVERSPRAEVEGVEVNSLVVEDVGPDGTLWALGYTPDGLQRVFSRSPGGRWSSIEGLPGSIALAVAANGDVYVAGRDSVTLLSVDGSRRLVAGRPRRLSGQTDYADERTPNPRPAASSQLPTLTGITVRADGTLVVLATDTVLTIDGKGTLRTVVSPQTSGTDPATRLRRATVRDVGGSALVDAAPYEDGVLVYDQRGGRLLYVDDAGRLQLIAGGPVNDLGSPVKRSSRREGSQWGADGMRRIPLDVVQLPLGGESFGMPRVARLAVTGDGQVLLSAGSEGILRLGLPNLND